jgi:ketosteroid isomerase-like protein
VEVNRPDVVAEVAKVFADYEAALVDGDNAGLAEFFWDSADVVRFGLADRQSGYAQLRAWRLAEPRVPPGRRLSDTAIVTFGRDFAVTTTLFGYDGYDGDGGSGGCGPAQGRQSQTWVRTGAGWRIVSAHVSWSR